MMNILSTTSTTPAASLRNRSPTTAFYAIALLLLSASLSVTGQILQITASSMRFQVGEMARLECFVPTGSNPGTPFNSWTKNSVNIIEDDRITVTVTGTRSVLKITNLQSSDEGTYTCSKEGFQSVRVTINVETDRDRPFFRDVQGIQIFAENTDAVVKCPAYFGSSTSMYWYVINENGTQTLIQNGTKFTPENERLIIHDISQGESGSTYRCVLYNSNPYVYDNRDIRVQVRPQSEYVPKIVDERRRITVSYDQALDLPCQLEEPREGVQYSWTIHTEFEHDHLVNHGANLQRGKGQFLGGIYTCRAENQFGYDIADFAVKITAPPMPSTCAMVRKTTNIGTTVVLKHCDLTTPVPLSELAFQWSKNGIDIVPEEGKFSINQHGWLTIRNVQSNDLGTYRVNISNDEGSAVHTVNLERIETATTPSGSPSSAGLIGSTPLDAVAINLKFRIQSGTTTCTDIKERTEGLFQEQLLQQFSFTDATNLHFENPMIECSTTSVFTGIFKTSVKGSSAGQLAAQVKARGITPFTLNNGQTVVVKICTDECTLDDDSTEGEAKPWINKTSGIVIAVTVISVMLTGAALLVVILIRYRRRSFHKAIDEEQILPLHLAPHTDLDKNFKPPYYRSISVNLPITSR